MMKKIVVSVLLVLMLVLFAGCGGSGDSGSAAVDVSASGSSAAIDDANTSIPADTGSAESEATAYERGINSETGFESAYLNFRFTAPEGYIMSTEAELDEMMGFVQEEMDLNAFQQAYTGLTTTYEMLVASTQGIPNIIVATEKLPLSNMTVEQYAETAKGQLTGYTFDENLSTLTLAEQDYMVFSGKTEMSGVTMVQDFLLKKADDRVIMITITYTDDTVAEKDALIAAFTPY